MAMTYEQGLVENHEEGVLTLRLQRPERGNSLDGPLGALLVARLVAGAENPDVRVIVLTGTGTTFCAGDDIDGLEALMRGDRAAAAMDAATGDAYYLRACEAVVAAPKPVVAALNGAAVGAGVELACAADYRLAASRVRVGSALVRLGHVGNAVMLPRVVGLARATELFVTGRIVTAPEALDMGLVDEVVADEAFDERLAELSADFAAGATRTIGLFKELRERAWGHPPEYGLRLQDQYHRRCCHEVADGVEGPAAYLEGRPPRFAGR